MDAANNDFLATFCAVEKFIDDKEEFHRNNFD
jgi:hypothetical protein